MKHCWCLCGKSLKTDLFGPSQTKLSDKLDDNLIVSSFHSLSLEKFNPNWNENGIQSTKSTHFTLSNLITFFGIFSVDHIIFMFLFYDLYEDISSAKSYEDCSGGKKRGESNFLAVQRLDDSFPFCRHMWQLSGFAHWQNVKWSNSIQEE